MEKPSLNIEEIEACFQWIWIYSSASYEIISQSQTSMPQIMWTIESKMITMFWTRSPQSIKYLSQGRLILDPHLAIHHSNTYVQSLTFGALHFMESPTLKIQ